MKNTKCLEGDFIYSLNYLTTFNVSVFKNLDQDILIFK